MRFKEAQPFLHDLGPSGHHRSGAMVLSFFCAMVAMAWKNLVHSSPNLILFTVYLFL